MELFKELKDVNISISVPNDYTLPGIKEAMRGEINKIFETSRQEISSITISVFRNATTK